MQTIQTLLSLFPLLFTLTLASQGGLERRQDLSGLPTCAQNCLVTSLATSSGGCSQVRGVFFFDCLTLAFVNRGGVIKTDLSKLDILSDGCVDRLCMFV